MAKYSEHIISKVIQGSIADTLEITAGDTLLSINGENIEDVFDYRYLSDSEKLNALIRKKNGEEWELAIEKDEDCDLGLEFSDGLMDEYRSCRNKCIFCFIDQMPEGMRETLYFKDDDARLSFLQGNYITLTNLSDKDMERILFYKLSPINISVHTTNPELRCRMLQNRFAGDALKRLKEFFEAGLFMNGQIVLCKGYNDKEELNTTINDLSRFYPFMQSVSVVPVGLTKFREGLADLSPFSKEESKEVLAQIHEWQNRLLEEKGSRFVFASDEWYLVAGETLPTEEAYEGYPQIENGVGMVRSLTNEVEDALKDRKGDHRKHSLTMATGRLFEPILKKLAEKICCMYPEVTAQVVGIDNHFFGESITVAGLLTGTDIISQLRGRELGDYLVLPEVVLRSGEDILLDDLSISDVEKALQTKVVIVKSEGEALVKVILREE